MKLTMPFLDVLAVQALIVIHAVTFLHKGPVGPNSEPVILRGTTVVSQSEDLNGEGVPKRVGWSAKLMRDVVTWYDLAENQIKFSICSESKVTLKVDMLDTEVRGSR